jgi:very-short-patch-repair endonuclease
VADAAIAEVARRQHGVFSRAQAFKAGFRRGQLDWRIHAGIWEVVDRSVYRPAATPTSWRQRLMAACLAGPAVASHRAAGLLWNLPGMPHGIVEVTALRHRRRHAPDVNWHESFHLSEQDITVVEAIPVTRPTRTFLDLGVVLAADALEEVLDHGLRRNLLDISALWRRLAQLGELRPGARRVLSLLERVATAERPCESVLETRFRQLLRRAALPLPTPQVEIHADETLIARIDFAYSELKLGIELDGAAYHSSEQARRRDRTRDNRLGALGWRILRFSWEDVHDRSDAVIADLRTALRA